MKKKLTVYIREKIQEYTNEIAVAGIIVTVISIAVSICVTVIAVKVDNELKKAVGRIEALSNKTDSTVTKMEPVLQQIAISLVEKATEKYSPAPNDNSTNVSQVEKYWKAAAKFMKEEDYLKAIEQYGKIVKLSVDSRKKAYFDIAIAYAKLSFGDYTDSEQESYRASMEDYMKKAARLGNKEAQQLFREYGEKW
jgi:tetratricopeptide (TPR) repeat protein